MPFCGGWRLQSSIFQHPTYCMSQADEHIRAVEVSYPGFSSSGPSAFPAQNGKPLHHKSILKDIYLANRKSFRSTPELKRVFLSKPMQLFFLDSFWWFFLDHFAAENFAQVLQRTRNNVLVSESELMTYVGSSGGAPPVPKKPLVRRDDGTAAARRLKELPKHVVPLRGNIRTPSELVKIACPKMTNVDAFVRQMTLDGMAVEPLPATSVHTATTLRGRGVRSGPQQTSAAPRSGSASSSSSAATSRSRRSTDLDHDGQPHSATTSTTDDADTSEDASTVSGVSTIPVTQGTADPRLVKIKRRRLNAVKRNGEQAAGASSSSHRASSACSSTSSSLASSHASDAALDRILQFKRFAPTYPSLSQLPPEVRDSIVTKEQHQLFTRMSFAHAAIVRYVSALLPTTKDAITRFLPDLLAQAIFAAFFRALPYATYLLDYPFQVQVAKTLSFWLYGVERIAMHPKNWAVHVLLDSPYRRATTSLPSSSGKKKRTSLAALIDGDGRAKETKSSKARRLLNASSPSSVAAEGPHQATAEPLARVPAPPAIPSRTRRVAPSATAARENDSAKHEGQRTTSNATAAQQPAVGAVAPAAGEVGPPLPQSSSSIASTSELPQVVSDEVSMAPSSSVAFDLGLAPPPRSAAAFGKQSAYADIVRRAVDDMNRDMHRLRSTHTFSIYHYGGVANEGDDAVVVGGVGASPPRAQIADAAGGRGRKGTAAAGDDGGGGKPKAPSRVAGAHALGPRKRTVQVIKEELDAKYREHIPWFANQRHRLPIKEHVTETKFELHNVSPLFQRFLLVHGSGVQSGLPDSASECIQWTV